MEDRVKKCRKCEIVFSVSNFYRNGITPNGTIKYKPMCKSCTSADVVDISTTKINKVLEMQNREYKCEICGYDKNTAAIDFHHIDESTKLFKLGGAQTRSIDKLFKEIRKCMILCSNCHRELHNPKYNKY